VDFSQATSNFHFQLNSVTFDLWWRHQCINLHVFYCIYSVRQYKHFEVWLVVLWFTVLEIMTISLSPTPKLSPCLSSERRTSWRHFWSYCRVTKSLPSLFCYARWSSSWKWKEISRTFFCTRWPPQRLDYLGFDARHVSPKTFLPPPCFLDSGAGAGHDYTTYIELGCPVLS